MNTQSEFSLHCSEAEFSAEELEVLKKFGQQLQSIATNHVAPGSTEEEFHFRTHQIRQLYASGSGSLPQLKSLGGKYEVFLKYWTILAKAGNLPEMNRKVMTPLKMKLLEDRATSGGLSTDDQNNRYDY